MCNSLKLYDENYKKLSIKEMTITYKNRDYITIIMNHLFEFYSRTKII